MENEQKMLRLDTLMLDVAQQLILGEVIKVDPPTEPKVDGFVAGLEDFCLVGA